MAKTVSGSQCVKILCRFFGFFVVRQKGSHVKLKRASGARTLMTVVPLHRELAHGTLHGILKLAEIEEESFRHYL
ncbi:addiction module toxin, HicA family [Candidatus Parcubacteria bacterium]|nr:addiction module toxin, HicA family [Candidatus Parcubacteria bacterium]